MTRGRDPSFRESPKWEPPFLVLRFTSPFLQVRSHAVEALAVTAHVLRGSAERIDILLILEKAGLLRLGRHHHFFARLTSSTCTFSRSPPSTPKSSNVRR